MKLYGLFIKAIWSLAYGLIFSSVASAITLDEFRREMREHQGRVQEYGKLIIQHHREHFPNLYKLSYGDRQKIIDLYFALHDVPKLMKVDQLKSFEWKLDRELVEELFDFYGLNCKPTCIIELNRIENEMKEKALLRNFSHLNLILLEAVMDELKFAEEIADVTDTKMHRARELGFIAKARAGEEFFLKQGRKTEAALSLWMEKVHSGIVILLCRRIVEGTL